MDTQKHIIKRQTIDLTINSAADAQRLQAEVSRIYRQRLVPLIDRCCSAASHLDQIHRIDRLEIDLGAIDSQHLEEELVAKLLPALRGALGTQIDAQEQVADRQGINHQARSQLELFAFFARTGSLPWWADVAQPRLLDDCLEYLLSAAPGPLRRLLRDLVRAGQPLRRIVAHYGDALLARLTDVLADQPQLALSRDLPAFVASLQNIHIPVSQTPSQLRNSAWLTIVSIAGLHDASYSSAEAFYGAVLARIAAERGVAYEALLGSINRVVQVNANQGLDELQKTLESLHREHGDKPRNARNDLQLDAVADPSATHSGFQSSTAPAAASRDRLSTLQQIDVTDVTAGRTADPPIDVTDVTAGRTADPPVDLRFSNGDEIYVGNAGLVILWPFLSHFFGRMELLTKQRFTDQVAMQRAVGLLQHLATAELVFPEYLLPLNKVLCGMELTAVFDFGPPISAAEAEECADLLGAMIAQAPILRDMSAEGLRGTFLLREGILRARDGAWLLQVERETYDIVLDRFPWSWEWVKLPWMDAPLRVEWS